MVSGWPQRQQEAALEQAMEAIFLGPSLKQVADMTAEQVEDW